MPPIALLLFYLALAATPLALAALRVTPRRPFLDDLASGMAIAAFTILLAEFVLSGRFRVVSRRMGMDVTMRLHQLLARTALILALLHPFLYSLPLSGHPMPWDQTRALTLGLDTGSIASGVAAWILLAILVLTSIFRDQLPYRYETWRALHGLGAALIAGLTAHHALEAGRYSADPALAGVWLLLLAVALACLFRTYVATPLRKAGRPYEVTSVRSIALKTWEVTVTPKKGKAIGFEAGQFVWLSLGQSPFSLKENPFSISSAPNARPNIQFVIKEAGDMTNEIGSVAPGTVAYLDGPHGNLTPPGDGGTGVALIAGGVGIAPLISIARQLAEEGAGRPMILLYGNRAREQIVYWEELEELRRLPGVEVKHVLSEPPPGWTGLVGQLDRAILEEVFSFDGAGDWRYLLCGPPAMLDAAEDALMELGVPAGHIQSERFRYD